MFTSLVSIAPVRTPPANGSLVARLLVTVVLKFSSSPNAAASSLSVSNAAGAESTRFQIAVLMAASVAKFCSLTQVCTASAEPIASYRPAWFPHPCAVSQLDALYPEAVIEPSN